MAVEVVSKISWGVLSPEMHRHCSDTLHHEQLGLGHVGLEHLPSPQREQVHHESTSQAQDSLPISSNALKPKVARELFKWPRLTIHPG